MKFIMIYGPPAAGKLTVAKELQKLNNFGLVHNHMVIDILQAIDGERSDEYYNTQYTILKELVRYSVSRNTDTIFTFVFGKDFDVEYFDFIKHTVEQNGGRSIFIQLNPNLDELLIRAEGESRKSYKKIDNSELLQKVLFANDYVSAYSQTDLSIDNTDIPAYETAKQIHNFVEGLL